MLTDRLNQYQQFIHEDLPPKVEGKLTRLVGLTLEAVGCNAQVGDSCKVYLDAHKWVEAEVVGFAGDRIYLMPVEQIDGARAGAPVVPLTRNARVQVGYALLGRVLDANGVPLDDLGPIRSEHYQTLTAPVINPLQRAPIDHPLDVGVRAINGLMTVGRGQRMGLFAGSGVGKSVLLGMMTRYTTADITVVGLIGERGREVKEFIDNILGPEGLSRSVVVASPADASPLLRLRAAQYCTAIAEFFRDQGKEVLLLMDSLTRYAQAQREIALAIGEPPATKGYPPSCFAKIPKLVERAGNGKIGGGSITAFYTVLTEGDDLQDPIADAARAILDGHIVLSRSLAEEGHYPAIDIEASISRAMTQICDPQHVKAVQQVKQWYANYQQNKDLISVGAYASGNDPNLDKAISMVPNIKQYLRQDIGMAVPYKVSVQSLGELTGQVFNPPANSAVATPSKANTRQTGPGANTHLKGALAKKQQPNPPSN